MNIFPVGLDPQTLGLRTDLNRTDLRSDAGVIESSALFSANPVNPTVIEFDVGKLDDVSEITRKVLSNIGA